MLHKTILTVFFPIALVLMSFATPAQQPDWVRLGASPVDGVTNHGTIHIENSKVFFRDIQLRVSGGSVIIRQIRVNYRNGSSEDLQAAFAASPDDRTRPINLPGDRRIIKSVDIWYVNTARKMQPEVVLYAMPETRRSFISFK